MTFQDPSDCEINEVSDVDASETLELPSETSKKMSSTPLDDFAAQWFKIDELNLSVSSFSDFNSFPFDSNSSDSDCGDYSDHHSEDSSLDEKEEVGTPLIATSSSPPFNIKGSILDFMESTMLIYN